MPVATLDCRDRRAPPTRTIRASRDRGDPRIALGPADHMWLPLTAHPSTGGVDLAGLARLWPATPGNTLADEADNPAGTDPGVDAGDGRLPPPHPLPPIPAAPSHASASMTRTALTLGAGLLALPVIVAVLVAGLLTTLLTGGPSAPSPTAPADIPADYLVLYQQAANDCPGLDWAVLAAIGKLESDHGRSTLPGVTHRPEPAGAGGPMQFLQPTFAASSPATAYPRAGRPALAVRPARRHPRRRLLPLRPPRHHQPTAAVFAYNHADTYVTAVLAQAAAYRQTAPPRTAWPAQRAELPDPSGTGGHVTARTAPLYRALAAVGRGPRRRHLLGPSPAEPRQRPPDRQSLRPVLPPHDPTDIARGWTVAHWLAAHQTDRRRALRHLARTHLDRRAPNLDGLPTPRSTAARTRPTSPAATTTTSISRRIDSIGNCI